MSHSPLNGALAQFATVTETALDLPEGLPREDWEEIGVTLHKIEGGVQWWLGDWWLYGDREYGESAAQAEAVGVELSTVQAAAWVAGRFTEKSRRRENLSWSHHRAVAGLEPDEADQWLDKAEGEPMTSHHLRAAVKKHANGGDSTSETIKLLRRAVEAFEHDNPDAPRAEFMALADGAWQHVHGLTA